MIRLMRRSAAAVALVVLAAGQVPGTARAADERPDLKIEMVDCGRSGMFDPAATACFEERFRACESATWIPEISLGGGTLAQRWEVVGPAETGCTVRNEYVAYSNPAYLGKEMLCTFDHGRPFAEAVGDWRACDGPLLDLMVGVGDPEREFAVERGGARQVERTTPPGVGRSR